MATLHHQKHSFINNLSPSTVNHRRSLPITHCTFFRQPRRTRTTRRPLLTVSPPPSTPLHATSNGAGRTVGGDGETTDAFTKYSGYLFDLRGSDFDSVTEYDLKKIASICRRNPFVLLRRLVQTGATLGKWFAVRYLDSYLERSEQMFQVRASELRNILTELGPVMPFQVQQSELVFHEWRVTSNIGFEN